MKKRLSQNSIDAFGYKGIIGSDIHFFSVLTSTFDKIREFEPAEGLTIVSSSQTAGCGRLGRSWQSNEGGIYFTFALTPPFREFEIPFITIVCALGVCEALSEYLPCLVKWPNDIVSNGRKLCGILSKNIIKSGKTEAVLVGIGINANNHFCEKELPYASSVSDLTGKEYDENAVLVKVLGSIDRIYREYTKEQILHMYKEKCVNLGKEVTLSSQDGEIKGVCTDILPDGSMNVKTDKGVLNVHSGEVSVKGIYQNKQEGKNK